MVILNIAEYGSVFIGCALGNEKSSGGHARLQSMAEHQRVFVMGDIFQGNQVVNGLYECGQILRTDVERAGGDQGVKSTQIDANGPQVGQLCG